MKNITPAIEISFKNYELLKKKVLNLYRKYANEQNEKMHNFYEEIKSLEGENVSTFNISIIEKVNSINIDLAPLKGCDGPPSSTFLMAWRTETAVNAHAGMAFASAFLVALIITKSCY